MNIESYYCLVVSLLWLEVQVWALQGILSIRPRLVPR